MNNHITVLEIDGNALKHNLQYFKNKLENDTKVLVVVKAFGYGSEASEIAKYLENATDIKDGKTYVILTENDGLVYKRVYSYIEEKQSLLLVSDNKLYDPYEVAIETVLEIWEYTCSINTQEYDEHELKISSIAQMFTQLGLSLIHI